MLSGENWDSYNRNLVSTFIATKNRQLDNLSSISDASSNVILNEITNLNNELSRIFNNTKTRSYRTKLNEIGSMQLKIKSRKDDLKKLSDELEVAEAREDAIKNRNEESSYPQTFGYIFRPFRRLSYAIIVPLIFIMVVASVYLLWTSPTTMKISTAQSLPQASAPPANNFNAQLKKIFK